MWIATACRLTVRQQENNIPTKQIKVKVTPGDGDGGVTCWAGLGYFLVTGEKRRNQAVTGSGRLMVFFTASFSLSCIFSRSAVSRTVPPSPSPHLSVVHLSRMCMCVSEWNQQPDSFMSVIWCMTRLMDVIMWTDHMITSSADMCKDMSKRVWKQSCVILSWSYWHECCNVFPQ